MRSGVPRSTGASGSAGFPGCPAFADGVSLTEERESSDRAGSSRRSGKARGAAGNDFRDWLPKSNIRRWLRMLPKVNQSRKSPCALRGARLEDVRESLQSKHQDVCRSCQCRRQVLTARSANVSPGQDTGLTFEDGFRKTILRDGRSRRMEDSLMPYDYGRSVHSGAGGSQVMSPQLPSHSSAASLKEEPKVIDLMASGSEVLLAVKPVK